jgi:hypothetical protein
MLKKRIQRFILILVIIFLVAFPKGGFKISNIPLTWGYMLILLSVPFGFINLLNQHKYVHFPRPRRNILLLCLPFVIYSSIILAFGTFTNLGFLFSYILSLLLMPFLFMFFFGGYIDMPNFNKLFTKYFIFSLRFVTIFGLILFLQKLFLGSSLEIPYLTVNIDDLGMLDEKYNMRGDIMKYTSTYNNGNIFGVCMLILAPIYFSNEKNVLFKIIFIISLALTLSRTVWFGMVFLGIMFIIKNIKNTKGVIILTVSVISIVVFLPMLLSLIGVEVGFLFDKNLGGRANQLNVFSDISLFGDGHYDGIAEIVYTSILQHFGAIGLILFLVYIFSPLIVLYVKGRKKYDTYHWGLILYPVICLSDGAMLFIPTMAFFWFLASYTFRKTENDLAIN